ncbi:ER lumen protein retaining receptor domain-containing protein [Ditylenchus destructor]|nr:ER lumen protein retaining receptor domain-containing protein [Ditylenchus destructor]
MFIIGEAPQSTPIASIMFTWIQSVSSAGKSDNECFPFGGRFVASFRCVNPPLQDMENEIVCWYLDLFTTYISVYNTFMKVTFVAALYATCYFMFVKFKATCNREEDTFRIELLLLPCAVLAVLVNAQFTPMEILWTFSVYLEAAETITAHYLFMLGSYRALYIVNWVYRYYVETFYDPIVIVSGIVQTVLYADFFYLYLTRVIKERGKLELPI